MSINKLNIRYHKNAFIDIERILYEMQILPQYEEQLALQTALGTKLTGEGALSDLDDVSENMFTEFIYNMPYTNSILKAHNVYRARIMNLGPKTNYTYHQDPTKRFHIPLITNDSCFFVIDDKVVRYPANGNYYIVDTTKLHTAINASSENRVHIVGCIDE
mgnify:CR=1 FL=1|tara:strand:+ start:2623 stop:3105 length:483 start_codon:yes stop_codon:yes gene_type:complete